MFFNLFLLFFLYVCDACLTRARSCVKHSSHPCITPVFSRSSHRPRARGAAPSPPPAPAASGIEPRASRMLSRCDTITSCARSFQYIIKSVRVSLMRQFGCATNLVMRPLCSHHETKPHRIKYRNTRRREPGRRAVEPLRTNITGKNTPCYNHDMTRSLCTLFRARS